MTMLMTAAGGAVVAALVWFFWPSLSRRQTWEAVLDLLTSNGKH